MESSRVDPLWASPSQLHTAKRLVQFLLPGTTDAMQSITQKQDRYIFAILGVLALAVLIFLWMCLELPTYPSPAVWALTAFAIYIPAICMCSVFRSLVTDVKAAPAETLNFVASVSHSLARFPTGFHRAFLWFAPSSVSSPLWVYSLNQLALRCKWHPSTHPQLK